MKICIPTAGEGGLRDTISEHFGRASTFTIVNLDSGEVKIIKNQGVHAGSSLRAPELIAREGVNTVICRGIGVKAIEILRKKGIDILTVDGNRTVEEAIEMFKKGKLSEVRTGCKGL